MLEHVRQQNKVIHSGEPWMPFRDVEARLAIVIRVGVIKLFGENAGVSRLVAQTESTNRFYSRKF